MALAVAKRECMGPEPLGLGDRQGGRRIQAATEQHHGVGHDSLLQSIRGSTSQAAIQSPRALMAPTAGSSLAVEVWGSVGSGCDARRRPGWGTTGALALARAIGAVAVSILGAGPPGIAAIVALDGRGETPAIIAEGVDITGLTLPVVEARVRVTLLASCATLTETADLGDPVGEPTLAPRWTGAARGEQHEPEDHEDRGIATLRDHSSCSESAGTCGHPMWLRVDDVMGAAHALAPELPSTLVEIHSV